MSFFEKKGRHKRLARRQEGQILLIVVLVSVISLTVGLAAVSRSITNTRVSTEESNSQKALTAAEAGLEDQIKRATGDQPYSKQFDNNSGYVAKTTEIKGKKNLLINNYELPVRQHEGADVWLSDYPDFQNPKPNTTLTVYWTVGGGSCDPSASIKQPAIEIVVLSGSNKNSPTLTRYAIDQCRSRGNGFRGPSVSGHGLSDPGKPFNYYYQLPEIQNGYIVRIIPIYADTKIGVTSNIVLPPQGYEIESTGTSGDTVRKVKVFQSFPSLPIEFFPYNLFNS